MCYIFWHKIQSRLLIDISGYDKYTINYDRAIFANCFIHFFKFFFYKLLFHFVIESYESNYVIR